MDNAGKVLYLTQIIPHEISEKSIAYNRYINVNVASFRTGATYKSYNDFITIYVLTKYFNEQNPTKVSILFERYYDMYKAHKHIIVNKINSSIFENMLYESVTLISNKLSPEETKEKIIEAMMVIYESLLLLL